MSAMTPREIATAKANLIPEFVITAVNEVLAANYNPDITVIYQEDVVEAIIKKQHGLTERDLINRDWLDFEPLFRAKGWKVEYHGDPEHKRWVFQQLEKQ